MRVGVFTPLLSQHPLRSVLERLKTLNIDTVELGTGNYPGDAHCKLSMLDNAKDTQIYSANLPRTGVLDTKPYTDERNRGWIFRTCGYGHGAEWWKEFVSTLHMYGYDYVLSIEHEDSLLSAEEGLNKAATFLNEIVIREKPGAAWWV